MAKKLSVRDIEARFKQMAAGSKRLIGSFDDVVGIAKHAVKRIEEIGGLKNAASRSE